MLSIIILSIILFASLFFLKFKFSTSSSSIKNSTKIIFCGTRHSGKTTLLSRIVNGKPENKVLKTQTSQSENVYPFGEEGKFSLVDVPGHERVRNRILDVHLGDTKAIIFVIDAEKAREDIRDSAEFFINILSNNNLYKKTSKKDKCKILIIANKQDTATAKSINAIKILLEKEIEILKSISERNAGQGNKNKGKLMGTDQLNNDEELVDKSKENAREIFFEKSAGDGEKFTFEKGFSDRFEVEFVGTSCVSDNDSFSFGPVEDWLGEQVLVR